MVICLERGADLHMAQLMSLPLTVSCLSKIQIGFTFLEPARLGSPGKGPLNGCVCVCVTDTTAVPLTYNNQTYTSAQQSNAHLSHYHSTVIKLWSDL